MENKGAKTYAEISKSLNGGRKLPTQPNLKNLRPYNPHSFDLNPKNARYFVIKSFSEDDVHQSIKHKIWCSTLRGNQKLDEAFKTNHGKAYGEISQVLLTR